MHSIDGRAWLGRASARAVAGWAAVVLSGALAAANPVATASTNGLPEVVRVSGPLQLGRAVTVHVDGLSTWVDAGNTPHKLLLFLEGRPSPGDYPDGVDRSTGELQYHLNITAANRELWEDLLRRPTYTRKVRVSVGLDADTPLPTRVAGAQAATLHIVAFPWGLLSLGVMAATLVALLSLARHTDLLRDGGPPSAPDRPKPYSLARTQMAIWFYLIFSGYLVLWLVTKDLNTITESLLALMGISAGTALGGTIIDNQKRDAAAGQLARLTAPTAAASPDVEATAGTGGSTPTAPTAAGSVARATAVQPWQERLDPGVSQGFLRDILSDGDGFSLHRFQIVAWNVALAVIFAAATYNTLRMPEFSATLLGLMGISAGTYLGFKVPER